MPSKNAFKFKDLVFDQGKFYWNKVGGLTIPSDPTSVLFALFDDSYGEKGNKLMYKVGKEFSKELDTKFKAVTPQNVINRLNGIGYGMFEASTFNVKNGTFVIKSLNDQLASSYKKLHGLQKKPVNHFVSGLLAGFFSSITKKNLECREIQCTAQGKSCCIFEIK